MAKKKAKRYSDEEKKEVLDFIEAEGRGGATKAVKKYKVSIASINNWKKKASGGSGGRGRGRGRGKGTSNEMKSLQELTSLLSEIEATERKLADLQKRCAAAKKKI